MTSAAWAGQAEAAGSGLTWLAGDHHVHTKYSAKPDTLYTVDQQVDAARRNGLSWLAITDHGGHLHCRHGARQAAADISRARRANRDLILFQGLEWNVPAGEHASVLIAPGPDELAVLTEFEARFDAVVNDTSGNTAAHQRLATAAVRWLGAQVRAGRVGASLVVVNHPGNSGSYGPRELRALLDADVSMVAALEGGPGHQAAGIPAASGGAGRGRCGYDGRPGTKSYPGYPAAAYRTHGGFDWAVAKVGGLWDALLAEGRPVAVTASSDVHRVFGDVWDSGGAATDDGRFPDPVWTGRPAVGHGDFWPGQYSRTHVGLRSVDHISVLDALRAGRVWVDHGHLIDAVEVTVAGSRSLPAVTLGGVTSVEAGGEVRLTVQVKPAVRANHVGVVPVLRRVDLIAGPVTGSDDPGALGAPNTRVVTSWEISATQPVQLSHVFGDVAQPFYLRLRGTDGRVSAPGSDEPRQDPIGEVDPWADLWFYTSAVFVTVDG
ncbi:PHP domain-containing protein [Catellatospora sp. NPDC049111]|uniref:PHP domain-containing protein n=1 Tax=Catellatospora sp. NPDC049111 TaxID=3155271 RepID=UPI0033FA5C99